MKVLLKLPRVSMNMEEATITAWLKNPGDKFVAGEPLYSIETEKTATEIEAPFPGTLLEILVAEGNNAQAGDAVCRVET
jgi:pyruvate/2-oxoglutarate dehydrogenase complex dihydrolipoamide acyltransferase (E2) component